ncbi:MAG: hypothetical protein K2P93_07920 [Alphaproteobacteria bacterium]|nr:hypothetical protein [Alphaproteobacteria bacterium]
MFKKTPLLIALMLPFSVSQSFAVWEEFLIQDGEETTKTVRAKWKSSELPGSFTLESAEAESFPIYSQTLADLPLKDGYPAVEGGEGRFNVQNIARQKVGNLYHLYKVSYQEEGQAASSLGFVQFGRMPSKGYSEGIEDKPVIHHPIIQKWMMLQITEQAPAAESLADANINRIGNRGLAMILPLFNSHADEGQKRGTIETCYELVCKLTKDEFLLPVEGTIPHVAMSLFHPEDPNIPLFSQNGFEVDNNPGFGWFYPKEGVPQPRTMVTRYVSVE